MRRCPALGAFFFSSALLTPCSQVLRAEIRARMRGEASLAEKLKTARVEGASATKALKRGLDEATVVLRGRASAIMSDVARHTARTENALAAAAGRQNAVASRQELALKALYFELQSHAKATRSALGSLEDKTAKDLAELEATRIHEVIAAPRRT